MESPTLKKRVEISAAASKQSSASKYKRDKSKTPMKMQPNKDGNAPLLTREKSEKEGRINNSSNMEERPRMDIHRDLRKRSINDFYFREKIDNVLQRG